jgi:hypothetical protein
MSDFFYLNYQLDYRTRTYCENWPINYQLNHVIRNSIKIHEDLNIINTYKTFFSDKLIKKYIKNYKIFLIDFIKDQTYIEDFIKKKCKWNFVQNDLDLKIKKEILVIFLNKLS